jgi:hypothetical protein
MTETKTLPTLEALTPEYLTLRARLKATRKILNAAQSRLAYLPTLNEKHAEEVRGKDLSGSTLMTAGQVASRGTGAGVETIYYRCSCDGSAICLHDPRVAPVPAERLKAAAQAVSDAEKAVAKLETQLAATDGLVDVLAHARAVGASHIWWPVDRFTDPRLKHYRGQPLTAEDISSLGHHGLRQQVATGSVIEVTA